MTSDVPPTTPEAVDAAITAATSAYSAAIIAIGGMPDPAEAFQRSAALWSALRVAMDANGRLRARLALKVHSAEQLSVDELAVRLEVSKSRAYQLLQAARAQTPTDHR